MTLFINGKTYEASELIAYVEKLEKENAELKKMYHESDEDNNKLRENIPLLTEAKELLKMALDWQYRCGNGHPTWQEVCAKIEQFLNSEVEK